MREESISFGTNFENDLVVKRAMVQAIFGKAKKLCVYESKWRIMFFMIHTQTFRFQMGGNKWFLQSIVTLNLMGPQSFHL